MDRACAESGRLNCAFSSTGVLMEGAAHTCAAAALPGCGLVVRAFQSFLSTQPAERHLPVASSLVVRKRDSAISARFAQSTTIRYGSVRMSRCVTPDRCVVAMSRGRARTMNDNSQRWRARVQWMIGVVGTDDRCPEGAGYD